MPPSARMNARQEMTFKVKRASPRNLIPPELNLALVIADVDRARTLRSAELSNKEYVGES